MEHFQTITTKTNPSRWKFLYNAGSYGHQFLDVYFIFTDSSSKCHLTQAKKIR